MIHYQLCCGADHAFDGWFRDSAAFEEQSRRRLVECPHCGSADVRRALMAPALPRKSRERPPATPLAPQPAPATASVGVRIPDEMRAVLQRLRAEVEKHCDYVGPTFADEARRIHNGEVEARAIYGETTSEQAEALADEGIEVARIPWIPRAEG